MGLDILYGIITTHNKIMVKIILVPPMLIKGSVKPVTGNKLLATAIWIKACKTILKAKPTANKAPNARGLFNTIRIDRYRINKYNKIV